MITVIVATAWPGSRDAKRNAMGSKTPIAIDVIMIKKSDVTMPIASLRKVLSKMFWFEENKMTLANATAHTIIARPIPCMISDTKRSLIVLNELCKESFLILISPVAMPRTTVTATWFPQLPPAPINMVKKRVMMKCSFKRFSKLLKMKLESIWIVKVIALNLFLLPTNGLKQQKNHNYRYSLGKFHRIF